MNSRLIVCFFGIVSLLAPLEELATAQDFFKVMDFDQDDGAWPSAALTQGPDGLLYGTTLGGGIRNAGLIYRVNPGGTLTTIYNFCLKSFICLDGEAPVAPLILGHDGAFYGTAADGGARGCNGYGCGTIFRVTTGGIFKVLHTFKPGEGGVAVGALVEATDGNFYGTTQATGEAGQQGGTIFRMSPGGRVTTLHRFGDFENNTGGEPTGSLVQAADGNLYGTLTIGGDLNCNGPWGCGFVYRMTLSGELTVMHVFEYGDGELPYGVLVQAPNGYLYGTTLVGGDKECRMPYGCGTIYAMDLSGNFKVLHRFTGSLNDGSLTYAGLIVGSDRKLYGVSTDGGSHDQYGIIFSIDPDIGNSSFKKIHSFRYTDVIPIGALVQSTSGSFYGTTEYSSEGLSCKCGTLYELSLGLGPFVTLERYFGRAGDTGWILGQGLDGAIDVSVNGVPAQFEAVSDTELMVTIPEGATSGYVTVTRSADTLKSNRPFQVIP